MTKKIIIVEPDGSFLSLFDERLKAERLDKEYETIQLDPTKFGVTSPESMVDGSAEKITEMLITEDVHWILIDINFIDHKNDALGIKLAEIVKRNHPKTPVFCVTDKTKADVDYRQFCMATLEAVEGVFIKHFLTEGQFAKKDFLSINQKANEKIALRKSTYQLQDSENCDVVVLAALRFELDTFTNMFESEGSKILNSELIVNDTTHYEKFELQCKKEKIKIICATEDRMGMPSTASLASRAIINFRPKFIIIIGIAAGVPKDTKIGDLLIASQAWDYGSGKLKLEKISNEDGSGQEISEDIFIPYGDHIPLEESVRNIMVKYKSNTLFLNSLKAGFEETNYELKSPELHIGPFASGAAVIANEDKVASLIQLEGKLIGFDMEVFGVFAATRTLHSYGKDTKPISMKAVSDHGDSHKNNPNKELFQRYAAYISANFLKNYLLDNF